MCPASIACRPRSLSSSKRFTRSAAGPLASALSVVTVARPFWPAMSSAVDVFAARTAGVLRALEGDEVLDLALCLVAQALELPDDADVARGQRLAGDVLEEL